MRMKEPSKGDISGKRCECRRRQSYLWRALMKMAWRREMVGRRGEDEYEEK